MQRKPRSEELNAKDRVRIYDNEVKISKLVNDFAILALKTRGAGVFEGLTDAELAKLVISQLPKPKDVDEDLRKDMVSLQASLEKLPSVEDITGELSRLRFANNKLIAEREIQQAVVDGLAQAAEPGQSRSVGGIPAGAGTCRQTRAGAFRGGGGAGA